jgi:hypothetical protein
MMLNNFQGTIKNNKYFNLDAPIREMTSLSNNMVENWFNTLKNHILGGIKNSYYSEIFKKIIRNILSKYNEYYFINPKVTKSSTDAEMKKKEIWVDKDKKYKNIRTKGFYKSSVIKTKINSPEEEKRIILKQRIDKYLNFFDKYKPTKNGLKSSIDKKKIHTSNTCPLDYFLLIIAGLVSLNPFFDQSPNEKLKKLFSTINNSILHRKWNSARIAWYEANPNSASKSTNKKDNVTEYDFFNDEDHSFFKYYSQMQTYQTIDCRTGHSLNLM